MRKLVTALCIVLATGVGIAAEGGKTSSAGPTTATKAISVEQLPKNELLSVNEAASGNSAALFVGVNEFDKDDGLASLSCAVNDAVGQAHLFVRELKLIPAENCILCLSGQPSTAIAAKQLELLQKDGVEVRSAAKSDILNGLTIATRMPTSAADLVIVSVSSHGFEDKDGIYIMPSDGLRSYLSDTAVRSRVLTDTISKSRAGKKMVILDACRERVGRNKSSGSGARMTQNFLHAFAAGRGQTTLTSCGIGQFSYEDPKSGHGVFTSFLLKGLRGSARPDTNGFVTVGSLSKYVADGVRHWIVRNKPDVREDNIPQPRLDASETARMMPLAIASNISGAELAKARKYWQDYKINVYHAPRPGDVIANSIGMKFTFIPAGEFMMGSAFEEKGRYGDEGSQHLVKLSNGFFLGVHEVTQAQYKEIMGKHRSRRTGDNHPVERVDWDDAAEFCRKLSSREDKTYRLPTEAEWEYACRAGTTTRFSFGNNESDLKDYAWYRSNSKKRSHPVGQKKPNAFGLYDMHGNVLELCRDRYAGSYTTAKEVTDPPGPPNSWAYVVRGGSHDNKPRDCRSANRGWVLFNFFDRQSEIGFRVVLVSK